MVPSIKSIEDKIGRSDISEAIEELIWITKEYSYENEALIIKSRFERTKRQERLGILGQAELSLERNKISHSILELLKQFKNINLSNPTDSPRYVIGIDFGDGESSVSVGSLKKYDEIKPIEIDEGNYSIPSILARKRIGLEHSYVIGEKALKFVKNVNDIDINFKWSPSKEEEQWGLRKTNVLSFIEQLYKVVQNKHPLITKNCCVFIGCPSNWNEKDKEAYDDLLNNSSILPEIEIVSESRAALLHFYDIEEVNQSLFNKKVILIDIGSSTTDISIINNFEVDEFRNGANSDLGLRLVDEKILEHFFDSHPNGKVIRSELEINELDYVRQLYFCRKAREYAQGREINLSGLEGWDSFYGEFLLSLNLENVLSQRGFWKDELTFIERYEQLLIDLDKVIPKTEVHSIILTGGGAAIKEIHNATVDFFQKEPLFNHTLYNISQGIAKYGMLKHNFMQFQMEVENLIQKLDNNPAFLKKTKRFYADFMKKTHNNSTSAIWRPIAYKWKKGKFNLAEKGHLKNYILDLYREWLKKPKNLKEFQEISDRLSKYVNDAIKKDVKQLFKSYNFPLNDFDVKIEFTPLMLFDKDFSPGSIFFDEMAYDSQDAMFKIIDKVPKGIRDIIPTGIIDFSLGIEEKLKSVMGVVVESMIVDGDVKEIDEGINTYIKGAIRHEFDSKSNLIKYFLAQKKK